MTDTRCECTQMVIAQRYWLWQTDTFRETYVCVQCGRTEERDRSAGIDSPNLREAPKQQR